jgi:hypothetical protein
MPCVICLVCGCGGMEERKNGEMEWKYVMMHGWLGWGKRVACRGFATATRG